MSEIEAQIERLDDRVAYLIRARSTYPERADDLLKQLQLAIRDRDFLKERLLVEKNLKAAGKCT